MGYTTDTGDRIDKRLTDIKIAVISSTLVLMVMLAVLGLEIVALLQRLNLIADRLGMLVVK